jgi:hypothetical protein
VNPWPNAANLGDMFRGQNLSFTTFLTPGSTMTWHDDTDLIPEPGSLALTGIAALALLVRRRLP